MNSKPNVSINSSKSLILQEKS